MTVLQSLWINRNMHIETTVQATMIE